MISLDGDGGERGEWEVKPSDLINELQCCNDVIGWCVAVVCMYMSVCMSAVLHFHLQRLQTACL